MISLSPRWWLLVVALVSAGSVCPQNPLITEADTQSIRAVIEAQLAAFRSDDAAKAFSFASEGIRRTFATPENFMAMVQGSYPVVYRPASVLFLKPERIGEEVIQRVQMSDGEGRLWMALYRMQRQPDDSWLINGCVLTAMEGSRT